jgi:peptidoglycan/xylan/chitin deacetylase (PgdA/CDA1 family)
MPGGDAHVYKFEPDEFDRHLAALARIRRPPALITAHDPSSWLITFDDGGETALTRIAPALEARGWRGHFFMTVGRIGTRGFLDEAGILELARRGHIVGSHSMTHPLAMSSCPREQLIAEWSDSVERLADLLGYRPEVASIPGGWFGREVAATAGRAGIRYLFTSEPVPTAWRVEGVTCVGRYTVWNNMSAATAYGFATGRGFSAARQRTLWTTKKIAKALLGPRYLALRGRLLATRG